MATATLTLTGTTAVLRRRKPAATNTPAHATLRHERLRRGASTVTPAARAATYAADGNSAPKSHESEWA